MMTITSLLAQNGWAIANGRCPLWGEADLLIYERTP